MSGSGEREKMCMKKTVALLLGLALLFSCLPVRASSWYEEGGYYFSVSDQGVKTLMGPTDMNKSHYNIPAGVDVIAGMAFSGCTDMQTVHIPRGVKEIGNNAFSYCTGLQRVIIPDSVTIIGIRAFDHCDNLQDVEFSSSSSLETIDSSAFESCKNLTGINIPDGVTRIGISAFSGCTSLMSVQLPAGLQELGYWAFNNCDCLTSLILPEGLTFLDRDVFSGCDHLMTVYIPDSVQTIRSQDFGARKPALVVGRNAAAHLWAVENDWPFRLRGETDGDSLSGVWIPQEYVRDDVDRSEQISSGMGMKILLDDTSVSMKIYQMEDGAFLERMDFSGEWVLMPDGRYEMCFHQPAGDGTETAFVYLYLEENRLVMELAEAEGMGNDRLIFIPDSDKAAMAPYAASSRPLDLSAGDPLPELEGYWKAVKAELDGVDVTEMVFEYGGQGITFANDHALIHGVSVVMENSNVTATPTVSKGYWIIQPGEKVEVGDGQITLYLHAEGEYLVAESFDPYTGALYKIYYVRDESGSAADPIASDTNAPVSAEADAFLSVFRHPATQTDVELVMASARACEKVSDEGKITAYLKKLGFPENRIKQYNYDSSLQHSVGLTLASREVVNSLGNTVTLYAIIVRGTNGANEWISNFDVGYSDVHLGFDEARKLVMEHLWVYQLEFPARNAELPLYWVTGYSRGAAVANMIAGENLAVPAEQVYCVTFATPLVNKQTNRSANILNFVFDGDVVTYIPFASWGFDRHGLTVHYEEASLQDIQLNDPADTEVLVAFLSSVSQEQFFEATLECLHRDELKKRNQLTLTDVLLDSIGMIVLKKLDHGDATLLTLGHVLTGLVFNSVLGDEMDLLLGELLPDSHRASVKTLVKVVTNELNTHLMSTYLTWIECIYNEAAAQGGAAGGR